MKKYVLITFLFTATHIVFGQIPIDSIKAIIKREVAAKRSKSIIVGTVDSNGIRQVFAEGVIGDNNPTLPNPNTIYEIGSITKVFTSLLLADMHLKQQLNLNDPISKYLPQTVKAPKMNGKEISLLTLSTHRSGMPRFPYNVDPENLDNPYLDYTVDQLYEYVANFEPPYDIDSKWRYSNIGYGLLGVILERVAQNNYEALVTQRICQPLKMHSTVVSLTAEQKLNTAMGYAETGTFAGFTDLNAIEAGGALRSNVNDMLNFAEANLGLVKTALLPAMEVIHIPRAKKDGNDTYTTMGWTHDGKDILFKDGGTGGYRTFLGIDKKNKVGVVVLSNSNNSVSDIGWHILDPTRKVELYRYPWTLLDTLRATVYTKGIDTAMELYQLLKSSKNASIIFNEYQLNYLGSELRRAKRIKEAIRIYELNVKEYPKSTLAYESLAETFKRNKNQELAIKYFEKALELDPQNPHWTYILEKLKRIENKKRNR